MSTIEEKFQKECTMQITSYLPPEVLQQIFQNLNFSDLKNASLVCKHWLKSADFIKSNRNYVLSINWNNFKELSSCYLMNSIISETKFTKIRMEGFLETNVLLSILERCQNSLKIFNILKIRKMENQFFNEELCLKKEDWIQIFEKMEILEELDCYIGNSEFIEAISEALETGNLKHLVKVCFSESEIDISSGTEAVMIHCKDLKYLDIWSWQKLSDEAVSKISNNASQLNVLSIYYRSSTAVPEYECDHLIQIASSPNLRSLKKLYLGGVGLTESFVRTLAENLSNLTFLLMVDIGGLPIGSLQAIYKNMVKLQHLIVEFDDYIDTEQLTGKTDNYCITRLKDLVTLGLFFRFDEYEMSNPLRKYHFYIDVPLPKLENLYLQYCHIPEYSWRDFPKYFKNLKSLNLTWSCTIGGFDEVKAYNKALLKELRCLGLKNLNMNQDDWSFSF